MESISFTLPLEPTILRQHAGALLETAASIEAGDIQLADRPDMPVRRAPGPQLPFDSPAAASEQMAGVVPDPATIVPDPAVMTNVSPAPPPPPPPVDAPATGAELDSDGLPWDSRIHAKTKTKLSSGKWRKLRGTDPETVTAVEAELSASMAGAPAATTPPPPPPPPPAGTTAAPMAIGDFMVKLSASGITAEIYRPILEKHGITDIPLLGGRPDLVPVIAAELGLA